MSGGAEFLEQLSLRPQWLRKPRSAGGQSNHAGSAAAGAAATAAAAAAPGVALLPAAAETTTHGAVAAAAAASNSTLEEQLSDTPLEEWEVLWCGQGQEPAIPRPLGAACASQPAACDGAEQLRIAAASDGLHLGQPQQHAEPQHTSQQQQQQQPPPQQQQHDRRPCEPVHAQHSSSAASRQAARGSAHNIRSTHSAPAFVPIKEWRTCEQVAAGMEALPAGRLDQRLLSAAMQQMVAVRCSSGKRSGDAACFQRLFALALPRLASFDAFGLCIVVRSAARLGAKLTGAELRAWSESAARRITSFNPQDLANSLYSVGLLGLRLSQPALASFCAAVEQRCGDMKPQEQANTLLGLVYQFGDRHRDQAPPADVEAAAVAVLQAAERNIAAMSHQELSNAAWAFSKLATRHACAACSTELQALFPEAADRAAGLPPQELSNLLLAQANLAFLHPRALAALVAAAACRAPRLEEQHLDNVLLAAAHLPHHIPAPHRDARTCASAGAGSSTPMQRCVDTADLVTLRQELLHRLATVRQPLAGYTPTCQAICRGVWALAVLRCCTLELWHAALAALGEWQEGGSSDLLEGYAQLYSAQLLLAAEGHPAELPAALRQRAQHAVCSIWAEATESRQHREVCAALRAAGVEHRVEYTPEGGSHSVDIALHGERIAIQVDGPHHFTANEVHGRHWPLGRTTARDRLLRRQGWHVLVVDCWSWGRLSSPADQQAWLLRELAAVRRRCGSSGDGSET